MAFVGEHQPTFPGYERHRIGTRGVLTVQDIQVTVADYYGIPKREMVSARRAREVARPRQVAMFLAKQLTPKSLPDIGKRFGGRDHTTVIHAVRRVEQLCHEDAEFRREVDTIWRRLGR